MNNRPTEIAVAVVEHQGRYLVGRRDQRAELGGLWEFPGGKVQPGESPAEAARRECREETGLDVDVGELRHDVEHRYPHDRLRLHFFSCRPLDEHPAPRPPFCWVAAEQLAALEFPAANAELVGRLTGGSEL